MRKKWMLVGLGAAFLAIGCGDEKAPGGSVTNAAAPAAPMPKKPAAAKASEPEDAALSVSGPIIVEHQVELTAQRDGVI